MFSIIFRDLDSASYSCKGIVNTKSYPSFSQTANCLAFKHWRAISTDIILMDSHLAPLFNPESESFRSPIIEGNRVHDCGLQHINHYLGFLRILWRWSVFFSVSTRPERSPGRGKLPKWLQSASQTGCLCSWSARCCLQPVIIMIIIMVMMIIIIMIMMFV